MKYNLNEAILWKMNNLGFFLKTNKWKKGWKLKNRNKILDAFQTQLEIVFINFQG